MDKVLTITNWYDGPVEGVSCNKYVVSFSVLLETKQSAVIVNLYYNGF